MTSIQRRRAEKGSHPFFGRRRACDRYLTSQATRPIACSASRVTATEPASPGSIAGRSRCAGRASRKPLTSKFSVSCQTEARLPRRVVSLRGETARFQKACRRAAVGWKSRQQVASRCPSPSVAGRPQPGAQYAREQSTPDRHLILMWLRPECQVKGSFPAGYAALRALCTPLLMAHSSRHRVAVGRDSSRAAGELQWLQSSDRATVLAKHGCFSPVRKA